MISGSTVRVLLSLSNWVSTTGVPAPLVDPDSSIITLNIYNSSSVQISTGSMVRDGVGTYHFDWTVPAISSVGNTDTYTLEFIANFNALPNIFRLSESATYI